MKTKKFFILLIFIFIFNINFCLYAETNISGIIQNTQKWIPKNSPYIISNTVVIGKNSFVKVYPGVTIKFKEKGKLIVKGALYIQGTQKNPVRILPYDGESFYEGIYYESKYKNIIEYTIMIRGKITIEGTNIILSNNYILNSTGILLSHFAFALIKNNYFYNNTYGVYAEGKRIKFSIIKNTFYKNRFAIYLKDVYKQKIENNNFFKNKVNITNYSKNDLKCPNNFWGFKEEKWIKLFIYDKKNNKKVGKVIYKPYLTKKLNLFIPPKTFTSLIRQYLRKIKREDKIRRVSFGGGVLVFFPFAPSSLQEENTYSLGYSAEFTANISKEFLIGVEGKMINFSNKNKEKYDYNLSLSNLYFTILWDIGYKKNVFLLPFLKIGNGISIISEQYKIIINPESKKFTTEKYNEIKYTGEIGTGIKWFILKFFALNLEGTYLYINRTSGDISSVSLNLTGNIYFTIPLFLND